MKTHNRDSIKKFYNSDASGYLSKRWLKDDVSRSNYEMTRDSLLETLRPESNDSILEVGCGAGCWTQVVSEKCRKLVAIDISENMIAEAKANVANGNVEFILGDFVDIDLKEKYDKIFSVRVFEHFDEKKKALEKIYEALNPNGTFVVITKTVPSIWNGRAKINRLLKERSLSKIPLAKHEESFWIIRISPWALARAMRATGFREIETYPVILRPPIFSNGEYEYPIISPPRDKSILQKFITMSKKVRKAPNPIRSASTLFTESYLIRAKKG
jgi:ubiquinone/menaquinone biosynthesis C-methylase UbiE